MSSAAFVGSVAAPDTLYMRSGKRLLDVVGSLVLLTISLPFMVLFAALILLLNGWPIIFVQKRTGQWGKEFSIYKFRTMKNGAATRGKNTEINDDRRTKFGRLLRPTHLDELPQLFNVLKGEMSLVGPRPRPPEINAKQFAADPLYTQREKVRPGITGLMQVNRKNGNDEEEYRAALRFDLQYMQHICLAEDFWILLKTVLVILRCEGI